MQGGGTVNITALRDGNTKLNAMVITRQNSKERESFKKNLGFWKREGKK